MIHLIGQNYSSREIIQNIFSPLVGVVTSSLADDICHKNNLSFVELLQPFSKLQCEAHFRDVSGTSVSIKGLSLNICDINWRPPQTVLARKMLNEAVSNAYNDHVCTIVIDSLNIEVPTSELWFEKWRETFLTVQFPTDHEFTRHFLSCLIVLSSDDTNIVETASKLTHRVHALQNVTPQKLPKWFYPSSVLNSYVVLHEGSQGDLSKAQQSYELLKSTFGESKCFLIQLNSLEGTFASNLPDYWAPYIKRQMKTDSQDQGSTPKSPQDSVSMISLPVMQYSVDSCIASDGDLMIVHPLSPVQENATEAINSRFSISTESISSQTINPNVWATEIDAEVAHGTYLNAMDVENLRHFVQDYIIRALIPYVEQLVVLLNEAIANKKGVSKSLLSATKRWFVTNKPGAGTTNQNAVIYTNESVELQTRKLGDLYFMFSHYNLAFQTYHQAKRDFNADSAWQYYAGALEMAAVSAFMLGTSSRKTYDYMEDAIISYLTVCKLQQFATRATLLSIECLKANKLFNEAAKQLIRMTSEESDLRSALLLEQAAYCFLATQPSMYRKYAFHIVLAGNRYSRASQRKHSYRCYKQAHQVFRNCGWSLAEDHIQHTMAKQAHNLKSLDKANDIFTQLLRPNSMQSAVQQTAFLKEYIQVQKEIQRRDNIARLLPIVIPRMVPSSLRVLVTCSSPATNPLYVAASNVNINSNINEQSICNKIEEMIAMTAMNRPIVFKPTCSLFTEEMLATVSPTAIVGEPMEISVAILNTIKCSITFTDIDLLWRLHLDNAEGGELSNIESYTSAAASERLPISDAIKVTCIDSSILAEREEKTLHFKLTPKLTGRLQITGLVGKIALTNELSVSLLGYLAFHAPPLQNGSDTRTNNLCVNILPPLPYLDVSFSAIPTDLIFGEIVALKVRLHNAGQIPIQSVYMGCDSPRWITLADKEIDPPMSVLNCFKDVGNEKLLKEKELRRRYVFRLLKNDTDIALRPQQSATIPMWIQAPYDSGEFTPHLIFYYTFDSPTNCDVKTRLVRHCWKFNVHKCLHIGVTGVISNMQNHQLSLYVESRNDNDAQQLLSTEVYIHSLELYCSKYRVADKNLFLTNTMELVNGELEGRCLKSNKSADFQFRVERYDINETISLEEFIRMRLSHVDICSINKCEEADVPKSFEMYSFLMKNETNYNLNVTNEELNTLMTMPDPHMTLVFNWNAVVVMNATRRIAHGQHFVQLRHLYERTTCPLDAGNVSGQMANAIDIYKFWHADFLVDEKRIHYDILGDTDNDTSWTENGNFVGLRCLLEDECH